MGRFMLLAACVGLLAVEPCVAASADCLDDVKAAEAKKASTSGIPAGKIEIIDRLLRRAADLQKEGKRIGCQKLVDRANNLIAVSAANAGGTADCEKLIADAEKTISNSAGSLIGAKEAAVQNILSQARAAGKAGRFRECKAKAAAAVEAAESQ